MSDLGRPEVAHRYSYRLSHGDIPSGVVIHHNCRHRPCVNPLHLVAVTPAENIGQREAARQRHGKNFHGESRDDSYKPRGRRKWATEERFWRHVQKGDSENDCWIWNGAKYQGGHGSFVAEMGEPGRRISAHRWAYEQLVGPIPEGAKVCHNCPAGDNPSCVNPRHLFLGSQRDNVHDMHAKGRSNHVKGERSASAVLTRELVTELRREWEGKTLRELAEKYGTSLSNARHILTRELWAHVPWPEGVPLYVAKSRRRTTATRNRKTWAHGSGHPSAKLNEEAVREIRKLCSSGMPKKEVARHFDISDTTVWGICNRTRWTHVL